MFLSVHINLSSPLHVYVFLVHSVLAQIVPHLDDICNLVDPPNSDMVGNDCHTDVCNQAQQVLQHSIQFFLFSSSQFIGYTLPAYN
jgi:hypothetical protein